MTLSETSFESGVVSTHIYPHVISIFQVPYTFLFAIYKDTSSNCITGSKSVQNILTGVYI